MAKRLQVIVQDPEYRDIQRAARLRRMSIAEWVRQALVQARKREPGREVASKLEVIRAAARMDFPGYGSVEAIGLAPAPQAQSMAASDAGIAGFYDNGFDGGAHGADAVGRLVGLRLKRFLADIDHLLGALVITDDDVEADSRVTLSTTMKPDAHGPIARIELTKRTARTIRNREFLVARNARVVTIFHPLRARRKSCGSTGRRCSSTCTARCGWV